MWPASLLGRINPLDVLVGLTVGYALIRRIRPVINFWLIGFGALMTLSVLWGGSIFGIAGQWEALFYALRLALYLWFILLAPKLFSAVGWRIAQWIGTAVALVGFIQLKVFPAIPVSFIARYGFDPHNGRLFATFFDPNLVASLLLITIAVTFGNHLRQRQLSSLLALLIQLAAMAATVSRSGLLGLAVAVGVILLAVRPRWLLLAVVIGMVGVFLSTTLWNRIVGGVALDATSQARFASWDTAFLVINRNPVAGVGYNFYQSATTALGRFTPRVGHIALAANASDSSLLTVWATTGIFGLLLFIGWLLSQTLPTTDRLSSAVTRGVVAGILINSLFINSLLYPFVLFLLALAVAVRDTKDAIQYRD